MKIQSTNLQRKLLRFTEELDRWALNPWRKYSLLLIVLLSGFFIGTSIGMINGVLALMDPVGALFTVVILELMVRLRQNFYSKKNLIVLRILDVLRIGLLYGLFVEAFKLF